jgi:lipopolysaccharide export LptBFGC system permease protein LptF
VKTLEELGIAGIMQRVREARLKEKEAKDKEFRDFYRRVELMGRMLVTQRFTHPFACIALALAAFPIGALNMGRSRLNNVSVGLVVMFLYYALTLSAERAARSALAPPEIALAIPGALFVIGSAYLIRKVRLEQLPDPTRALKSAVTFLRANLRTSRI